jgi:lysozyme
MTAKHTFHKAKLLYGFFILFCLSVAIVLFDITGYIWHNAPLAAFYSVKGLDVSHHQGKIDWKKVAETKKYQFVYIKATEGHDYFDDDFLTNWNGAKEQGLRVGAYHFFSKRSSGKEQAEYFISYVPKDESALPPVIDIEIDTNLDPDQTRKEITDFVTTLENHYGKKPIMYVMYETYNPYIKGHFAEYHIWIRDVLKYPSLDRKWLMWQYNNRGRVSGIDAYVDINVFNGTPDELQGLQTLIGLCQLR